MTRESQSTFLNLAAVVAALAVALLLAVLPVYASSETLVEHEGAWVMAVVLAPALVAALPLALPVAWRRRALIVVATIAVWFVIVAGFTIGVFFFPTAVLLVLAARRAAHDRR
jgi:MFS family permease